MIDFTRAGPDRYFVKRLSAASDWIMRASGDRVCRQYLVWQAGIMDQSPDCIDHTVVAMSLDGQGQDAVLTIVMRDVGGLLIPPGDAVVPAGQHAGFIAHMAALHAAFWDWDDQIGLTTMPQRIRFFAPTSSPPSSPHPRSRRRSPGPRRAGASCPPARPCSGSWRGWSTTSPG